MPISMKTVFPFILFALLLSGCNDQPQKRPGTSQPPSHPLLTQEELVEYSKAIAEPHEKFSRLLKDSTPGESSMRFNGVDPETKQNVKKAETFLAGIDEIDISKCPDDYKKVFNNLKGEWAKFYVLIVKNQGDLKIPRGPRRIAGGSFDTGLEQKYSATYESLLNLLSDPEYKEALDRIKTATEAFEPVAVRYNYRSFSSYLPQGL